MSVPDAAHGFDRAADTYERARPEYPPEAVAWLAERLDLRPGRTVADVAAGTGKLTRALVGTGARVVAVEPLAEMRRVLVEAVPEAEALEGTAEALPLADASVDAVTVAAAFHWFDVPRALVEFARVLRPGAALGLVWNVRETRAAIQRELDELLEPHALGVSQGHRVDAMAHFPTPPFGPLERSEFVHEQRFDADGLVERVASISFVALLPDDEREELLARVRALGRRYDAPFPFPYRTEVLLSRRE
ncbi:MAG TPA: methyltransferase domain-containing protein [Gaiellaceae bacterium]